MARCASFSTICLSSLHSHSQVRALKSQSTPWKIYNRFNNLSTELYVSGNAKCHLATPWDFSHCVTELGVPSQTQVVTIRCVWGQRVTAHAATLGIRFTFVCIFIWAQNCFCDPGYAYSAVGVACGTTLKGRVNRQVVRSTGTSKPLGAVDWLLGFVSWLEIPPG